MLQDRRTENQVSAQGSNLPKRPTGYRLFLLAIRARLSDRHGRFAFLSAFIFFAVAGLAVMPDHVAFWRIVSVSFIWSILWTTSYVVAVSYADYMLSRFPRPMRAFLVLLPVASIVGWLTSVSLARLVPLEITPQDILYTMIAYYCATAFTRSIELANFGMITENPAEIAVPFFRRLRVMGYAPLIRIEAQDHYLCVVTRDHSELNRMRLIDAAEELAEFPGMRVHRSHWIAFDEIAKIQRDGKGLTLKMSNGDSVPVSTPNRETLLTRAEEHGVGGL